MIIYIKLLFKIIINNIIDIDRVNKKIKKLRLLSWITKLVNSSIFIKRYYYNYKNNDDVPTDKMKRWKLFYY